MRNKIVFPVVNQKIRSMFLKIGSMKVVGLEVGDDAINNAANNQ